MGLSHYRRSDVHAKIIDRLKVAGGSYKYIGHRLHKLRRMRNKADYDLSSSYTPTLRDLNLAVELSREIVRRAGRLTWPPGSLGSF